jgi:hypothetical protein
MTWAAVAARFFLPHPFCEHMNIPVTTLRQQANALHRKNDLNDAIATYRKCLEINPVDAGVWCDLGVAYRQKNLLQNAIACYRRALSIKENDAGIWSNLGNALTDADQLQEAVTAHETAVHLAPDDIQFRFNFAVALRERKAFAQAAEQLDICIAKEPDNAKYAWDQALNYLYQLDFLRGWALYESRWKTGALPVRTFPFSPWQGQSLQGKNILLIAEQGYGDTILAARFVAVLQKQGARVSIECKTELHRLFSTLNVDSLIEPSDSKYLASQFDYVCPMMSLPGLLGIDDSNMPAPATLHVPADSLERFRTLVTQRRAKLNVGIIWSGSTTFKDNKRRAATLSQFMQLAAVPGVQLFSLQKGPRETDLKDLMAEPVICDLAPHLHDFADTAAAVTALDLIVMTDSSVAHLAGSLGRPVINLLQFKPYWLYTSKQGVAKPGIPEQETTPWYSSMKLIRQTKPGDWDAVFQEAKAFIDFAASTAHKV